jgi:signal transduction histidine kinase
MRRLLGVLRHEGNERPLTPQPGLGQLDGLLGTMRGAGLPVDLIVEGELRDLPQGLDLSAYRVVQEALTNVLKHAGATRATVAIDYRDQALEIEVRDDGRGGSAARDGLGQGLIGMRERVAVYGGTLDCGPRRGGGFTVRARFPVPSAG